MNSRILFPTLRAPSGPRAQLQLGKGWVCHSCRTNSQPRVSFSSSRRSLEKPYYITTPIFYVNAGMLALIALVHVLMVLAAAPHVGHFYTMVLTDILKR